MTAIGRKCRACGEHKLPEGYYWRTNASGNRSLMSRACRVCFCAQKRRARAEAKDQRLFQDFAHATLTMVNPSLPPGITRQRRILAGGGYLHITETNP